MHQTRTTSPPETSPLSGFTAIALRVASPRPGSPLEHSAYAVGSAVGGFLALVAIRQILPPHAR